MFRKNLSHIKVFLILVGLSVAVGGCFESRPPSVYDGDGIVDKVGTCGWSFSTPAYEIVNNTKQGIFYAIQRKDYHYIKDTSVPSGGTKRGELADPTFIKHSWRTNSEVSIVTATLIAIRLDKTTVVYYTGYPRSLSDELDSWIMANQSSLASDPSALYNPMPTAGAMDAYGLFYIVRNAGRIRLGLPTKKLNECNIYTSLDSRNRPHSIFGFVMTFTVNGLNKSDIIISYQGSPDE